MTQGFFFHPIVALRKKITIKSLTTESFPTEPILDMIMRVLAFAVSRRTFQELRGRPSVRYTPRSGSSIVPEGKENKALKIPQRILGHL